MGIAFCARAPRGNYYSCDLLHILAIWLLFSNIITFILVQLLNKSEGNQIKVLVYPDMEQMALCILEI
jgi:hypothetical protein